MTQNIEFHTTNGCVYCKVMKETLDASGLSYKTILSESNIGAFPQLYYKGTIKFLGLPHMLDLLAFISEIKK